MKNAFYLFTLCLVTACSTSPGLLFSTPKTSENTIQLQYRYNSLESSVVNWNQLKATAAKSCENAGYRSVGTVLSSPRTCLKANQNNICEVWSVSAEYRCS